MDELHVSRLRQANHMKKFAFFGVAISTVATLSSVIVIPLLYYYIQTIQSTLTDEVEFCRSRSTSMWNEFAYTRETLGVPTARVRRQSGYSSAQPRHGGQRKSHGSKPSSQPTATEIYNSIQTEESCCTCMMGRPGPAGQPGAAGQAGYDGAPGEDGRPGPDAIEGLEYGKQEWCFDCPPAPFGSPGPQGPKGPVGSPGQRGLDGQNGMPGPPGPIGPTGRSGFRGSSGVRGTAGNPGTVNYLPGGKGSAGRPGPPGTPGLDGLRGKDGVNGAPGLPGWQGDFGAPGSPGRPGTPGLPGQKGSSGNLGACDHCPVPRLESGYYG